MLSIQIVAKILECLFTISQFNNIKQLSLIATFILNSKFVVKLEIMHVIKGNRILMAHWRGTSYGQV